MPQTNPVDVNDLLSKLISAGIINKTADKKPAGQDDGPEGRRDRRNKA